MAVAYASSATDTIGATALQIAYPASIAAGDMLGLFVVNKYPSNGPATPTGYTAPANNQYSGGSGSAGTDTGTVYVTFFYKLAAGDESGSNLDISIPSANSSVAAVVRLTNGTGSWSIAVTGGAQNTAGTAWSVTMPTDIGITAGDVVMSLSGTNTDLYTHSAEALTAAGLTVATNQERRDLSANDGNDCGFVLVEHSSITGTASVAAAFAMTASGTATNNPAGATLIVRFRELSSSLTDVDTDEAILAGQTSIAYTGTGLTDADGMDILTGTKVAAGTSIVATNSTSGTFTAPTDSAIRTAGVKYGACTFSIEDGGVLLATLAGTINPSSAFLIHNVTDISQAADTDCIYYGWSPAASAGPPADQVAHASTTTLYGWVPTIDSQGFVSFASGGDKRTDTMSYYAWDATDETWSTVKTVEISVAPILTLPTAVSTGTTTATLTVTTDEAEGTIWVVVTTSATLPSHAQIKAGQNHSGAAASYASSDNTPTTVTSFSATGLTAATTYYAHFTQENAATTPDAVATRVSSDSFITGSSVSATASVNEAILVVTGYATVNDGLRAFYVLHGATSGSTQDLERQFLLANASPIEEYYSTADLWQLYLGGKGYTGSMNDKALQWWRAGAPV